MPTFENALEALAFTRMQLDIDARAPVDWSIRLERWRHFARDESTWRSLIKVADQPGPARDEALARVEEKVPGMKPMIDLRDDVEVSLRALQSKR